MRSMRVLVVVVVVVSVALLGMGCAGPRYQVAVSGNTAILLDTYTGETWYPSAADAEPGWISMGPRLPTTRP